MAPIPYLERLKTLNLKQLNHRRKVNDIVMTHKIITKQTHLVPQKYFDFALRSKRKLYCLRHRKFNRKTTNNFFIRVINNWNGLSNETLCVYNSRKFRDFVNNYYKDGQVRFSLFSIH